MPENIFKRVNALKNIHMDVQKLEHEMYIKLFLIEAEQHKKMADLLKKRADIINGEFLWDICFRGRLKAVCEKFSSLD